MAKNYVGDTSNMPLSRFSVLVAQLESIVASAAHKPPDPLLCFDLLSDLVSVIGDEPKDSVLPLQRKCEDALYSLVMLGARRVVRHLASVAITRIIMKGDMISIYSRASSLQGFLSEGKKNEPQQVAGAAQCLGELYRHFGKRITSGLHQTTFIVTKLMKFNEEFVRVEALRMLQSALEGCGSAASSMYSEAYRIIMRFGVGDKSFAVRIAAARCLKAFANAGGPCLGVGELDSSSVYCVKAFEDPVLAVRDAFSEALGALLALGMNFETQVQPRGKGHFTLRKLDGGLQKYLTLPFIKASGPCLRDLRIGITLSWVSFLQAIRLKYLQSDNELVSYASQVMDMLHADISIDTHALACVIYILRVGITDQMTEPTQRTFSADLAKQLQTPDASPAMLVAALRTLSYVLKTLGEVPLEFKEVLDYTVVVALSHSSSLVRVEAALTLRALAEVDPTCVGGLISFGVTTLNALRENVTFEKGSNLKVELDSLHGQATLLAALISISPKLPLGYPSSLPRLALSVSKKMLTESNWNPMVSIVEKEAGWMLLSSLLASMPRKELESQVFDILSLWASPFDGNLKFHAMKTEELISTISVWSAAIDALTAFIRFFLSPHAANEGILLQPILLYLSRALTCTSSLLPAEEQAGLKQAMDIFITKLLTAYQSLSDPLLYKSDHVQIIQICTTPFRDAAKSEKSSSLRTLLDKRDAWLGPWTIGRDWFEDELRAFEGGKDGILPCVWEAAAFSFPQPESVGKALVNQKLACFGIMFSCQDSSGMLSLLGMIDHCLKAGKKQSWHSANVTNICVGLIAGLKSLLSFRTQTLGLEILSAAQAIFQSILAEGDICASQRRASSEGLGLLARFGNDTFTARLTKTLLVDVIGTSNLYYSGSIAFALGCLHRSAGGMALSSLVPTTVNSISSLVKSSVASLQIWSLCGLLLTIEAAGLSYIAQIQGILGVALDILLTEENGWIELQQGMGRLINAIVAVLGPELAPGSILFSRCKAVIAEISSQQEKATLLESVRFSQQLVLFAPHAVTVHSHVQTLLPTLSSRQPTLRHLAVSTLRHLIEKDPVSVLDEQIEEVLFHILDEETDSEIGSLVRATVVRLLCVSCPSRASRWLSICRKMILETSYIKDTSSNYYLEGNASKGPDRVDALNFEEDDESMVSRSNSLPYENYTIHSLMANLKRDVHLRYRTRVFAAECLSKIPTAVGMNPAHFDLRLARVHTTNTCASGDWLVLHLQEFISLGYQISTIQFVNMRPIGVELLSTIVDKFEMTVDPELPGHLLLAQYQAQLVLALRTALHISSGPILLEAGLQLATKILMSGVIRGDQAAVKRIFSLISLLLNDFNDLYYPSFADWITCKIKVRLLMVHASLKCYTYASMRQKERIPDEYIQLLPLFSENSIMLKKYWLCVLRNFSYLSFGLHLNINWKSFLDEVQSPLLLSKLIICLEESWPVIVQAVALDAAPVNSDVNESYSTESKSNFVSGFKMVELEPEEFCFLWGFAMLILFQGQVTFGGHLIFPVPFISRAAADLPIKDLISSAPKFYETALTVFLHLSSARFFGAGYLTLDICVELLQAFSFILLMEGSSDVLLVSTFHQICENCPQDFFGTENFANLSTELCMGFLHGLHYRIEMASLHHSDSEIQMSLSFLSATTILHRLEPKMQLRIILPLLLLGNKYIDAAPTESYFNKASEFLKHVFLLLKSFVNDRSKVGEDGICYLSGTIGACLNLNSNLAVHCIDLINQLESKTSTSWKMLQLKLAFSLEQIYLFTELAYGIESYEDFQEYKSVLVAILRHCIQSFHNTLDNSNFQVQAVALQVIGSMLKRGSYANKSLSTIFVAELLFDILSIIQKMLMKQINREMVPIIGESLKTLILLQTMSSSSECQKSLLNMLLQTSIMVFLTSEDNLSSEAHDLRTMAVKLISQLVQLPSSAVYVRDILLEMPVTQRHKLQVIIRASVAHDQVPTQPNTSGPPLAIKLPAQLQESGSIPMQKSDSRSGQDEEEDDDWDTFQSFTTSKDKSKPSDVEIGTEGHTFSGDDSASFVITGNNDFQKDSSKLEGDVKEIAYADERETSSDATGHLEEMGKPSGSECEANNLKEVRCDNLNHEMNETVSCVAANRISSAVNSVEVRSEVIESSVGHDEKTIDER